MNTGLPIDLPKPSRNTVTYRIQLVRQCKWIDGELAPATLARVPLQALIGLLLPLLIESVNVFIRLLD